MHAARDVPSPDQGAGTKISKPVLVTNIETGVCVEYSSMTKAAEFLNTSTTQIASYIKKPKAF